MAIVNKFNVNNKQVTLDADIIENMSANDVSYDSSTQYNENTVGDKLSKLEESKIKLDYIAEVKDFTEKKTVKFLWEEGNYDTLTGEKTYSEGYVRTKDTISVRSGDTIAYTRSESIIDLVVQFLKYKNGFYTTINKPIGSGAVYTVDEDCELAFFINKNQNESTLEQRINVARNSVIGNITISNEFPIVKEVRKLSGIDLRVNSILQEGINFDEYKKVGHYYTVTDNKVKMNFDGSSTYTDFINVSNYKGRNFIVKVNDKRSGSLRCLGFCDELKNVTTYKIENDFAQSDDGSFMCELLIDSDYLFFSVSSTATEVKISIPEYKAFYTKQEVDILISESKSKKKFSKNYHFSFDDFILALKDITDNASTYSSIFDNSTFAWCKEMHDKYGTVISFFCFYSNENYTGNGEQETFNLSQCTSKFANEFTNNAEWLKFGFHCYSQSYNYLTYPQRASSDYSQFISQILRITGSVECIDRLPRLQSYAGTVDALKAMRDSDCGILGALTAANSDEVTGRDSYYFSVEQNLYMLKHCKMYDATNQLTFFKTSFLPNASIDRYIDDVAYVNLRGQIEIFTHENQLSSGYKQMFDSFFSKLKNNDFGNEFSMYCCVNI